MTRTPDLHKPVDAYLEAQQRVIDHWWAIQAQADVLGQPALHATSEATLSACATNWEAFRTDWHIRAIACDATQFRTWVTQRVVDAAKSDENVKALIEGIQADPEGRFEVALPKHPTMARVAGMLDPNDYNLTFKDKQSSDKKANNHLVPELAALPKSLDYLDWKVLALMVATRNAIAHGSVGSMAYLKKAISDIAEVHDSRVAALGRRNRSVPSTGIGRFLTVTPPRPSGQPPGTVWQPRVITICERVRDMGAKFRP